MEYLYLNNLNVYSTENELFVSIQDDDLVIISGEEKYILELIIEEFKDTDDKIKVFENLKEQLSEDQTYFDLLLDYLFESKILLKRKKDFAKEKKNLIFIGYFENLSEMIPHVLNVLNNESIEYDISQIFIPKEINNNIDKIDQADMIILFSSFILDYTFLNSLNQISLERKIPIFHLGLGVSNYTLGPIFDANLHSPTLNCYIKRKFASYQEPNRYVKVASIENKKKIVNIDFYSNKYFEILILLLKIELEKYFINKKYYLVGREVEFDGVSFSTSTIRILRVNNASNYFKPFNI